MWKLTCANTAAMLRSRRLWIGAGFVAVYDVINLLWSQTLAPGDEGFGLDFRVFEILSVGALLVPVVAALFINTDYHDGTIRNKLCVGHRRYAIYLANLVVCCLVGVFYFALHLLMVLPLGHALGGRLTTAPGELLVRGAASLGVLLSLTAIAVAVSTLMTHRAVTVVIIFMAALLLDGAMLIENQLAQPPEVPDITETVETVNSDGDTVIQYVDREGRLLKPSEAPMVPNPMYVGEPVRSVLRWANDLLPGGQIFQLMSLTEERQPPWAIGLGGLTTAALSTALGLMLFRRKDLK